MANIMETLPPETVTVALLLLKLMYLVAIGLYVAFAVLVVRQISLMTGTLISSLSQHIKLIGFIHLLIAIGAFIFALVIL